MASPSMSTSDEGGTRFEASRSDGPSSTRIGRSISGQQEEIRAGLNSTKTMDGVENRTAAGDLSHRSCQGGGGAQLGAEKPSATAAADGGGGGAAGANVGTTNGGSGGSNSGDGGSFECNICLELATDPVITLCGHLFCWPCLYRWLQMHAGGKKCPVCKAGVDEEKVIPLYGRGNPHQMDPRKKPVLGAGIPARPQGQRPESTRPQHQRHHHQHGPGFGFMDGEGGGPFATAQFANFTLSAGFGLFPSLFGLQYHFPGDGGFGFGPTLVGGMASGPHGGTAGQRAGQTPEMQQQQFLSKLLLMLGSFVIICLLLL